MRFLIHVDTNSDHRFLVAVQKLISVRLLVNFVLIHADHGQPIWATRSKTVVVEKIPRSADIAQQSFVLATSDHALQPIVQIQGKLEA